VTSVTHSKKEIEMVKFMVRHVVLMLLIMGCATSLEKEKENWMKFDETSRAYLIAIRWGEYEAAYAFKRLPDADTKVANHYFKR
jgi:CO dehydrogenase/acetyl-CoA synthase epsilon subunit